LLRGLNKEQKEAVKHNSGPLLIIAGAGTGKTKVITHRLAYLLREKLAKPEEIVALTFTDKAAEEMERRVDILLPYGLVDTWISTFHAFGDRILREEAVLAGLSPDFRVMTQPEQIMFFQEHLPSFKLRLLKPITNPTKNIEAIIELISRAKDENIGPQQYCEYLQRKDRKATSKEEKKEIRIQKEIVSAYSTYEKLKEKYGLLDFGDQVFKTFHLFKDQPQILKKYRKQFKYILVDEFQDTNYLQNELVKLLAPPQYNLTVVGDDDQSIYKFRGASLSNIMQFKKDFPRSKQIVLNKNYRNSQRILDSAYQLIKHNNPDRLEVQNRINKRLISQTQKGKEPELKIFDQIQNEADSIAGEIKTLNKKGIDYQDVAILVRGNSYAEPFIQALNNQGIPWVFSGASGLYQEREVQLLAAFLRTIASNQEDLALYSLAESFIYQMPADDLIDLLDQVRRTNHSLYWTMKEAEKDKTLKLSQAGLEILKEINQDIAKYRELAKNETAGQVLYQFLKDKKILKSLTEQKSEKSEIQIKNIAHFFNRIKEFEEIIGNKDLQHLVKYLDSIIEAGDNPERLEFDPDFKAVNILTVHAAKGLEFDTVFLVSLTADRFPSIKRGRPLELPEELIKENLPKGDSHLQEERRLFYVALTRAKNRAYFSMSYDCGGQRQKRPSPFINEVLGEKALSKTKEEKTSRIEQVRLLGRLKSKRKPVDKEKKILYLTPYQIDDYRTCPLKYKYVNIIRLPLRKKFQVVFGSILHHTIQVYLSNKQRGRELSSAKMLKYFEKFWQNEGLFEQKNRQEEKKRGQEILKRFFKAEENMPAPISVEESFSIKFQKNLIRGRWDAAYQNNQEIQLIDFKSSDIPDSKKAKQRVYQSLQLDLYSWGFLKKNGQLPDRVGLYFLSSGNLAFKKPNQRTIERAKKIVREASQGIRREKFSATPDQFNCRYCAFNQICPYAVKKP